MTSRLRRLLPGATTPVRRGRSRTLTVLIALGVIAGVTACTGQTYRDTDVEMTTAGQVDLERYTGRWYEIARFPNSFEEGCVGVTADYTLNDDGTVKVVNTCRKGTLDGPVETAEGRAEVQRPEGDRLSVGFVEWLPFARGDYWILDVDPDYRVAVIGAPAGTTGWVLARTPTLSAERLEAAYAVLLRNGYDVARIVPTLQAE